MQIEESRHQEKGNDIKQTRINQEQLDDQFNRLQQKRKDLQVDIERTERENAEEQRIRTRITEEADTIKK